MGLGVESGWTGWSRGGAGGRVLICGASLQDSGLDPGVLEAQDGLGMRSCWGEASEVSDIWRKLKHVAVLRSRQHSSDAKEA